MAGLELTFSGHRGHAGTVPMELRSDALGAAARFVVDAHDVARSLPGAVATIGRLTVAPGATNTIPERCELFADLRAPDDERVEALVSGVEAAAREAASAANCEVAVEPRWRYEAVAMSPGPKGALTRAVESLGVEPTELPSGAGHDAAIMALAGVPSAMLFVRSDAGGVSHAPEELSGADAVALGVQALEAALRELAGA
jgi:hydantoinase/carbamoylase family amidase